MKSKLTYPLFIILLSLWLGWTVLVDFAIVPTLFANMKDFFEAGNIGILLFSKLNSLEIIIASFLLALLCWIQVKRNDRSPLFLLPALVLWLIVMFYFLYLTPKITTLTALWRDAESKGLESIGGYADIQQAHQFAHRLYVSLDSAKLILILFLLNMGIYREEKLR